MNVQRPAFEQIQEAIEKGQGLCLDARTEAMGDKIALTAVAKWLHAKTGQPISILESRASSRTPFMLSEYRLPTGVHAEIFEVEDSIPYFNCHTAGTGADSLWVLNPYLAMQGIHAEIKLQTQPKQMAEVVFAGLTDTPYNQRRDMDPKHIRATVDRLAERYSTKLLYDKPSSILGDALNVPLTEAIEIIAGAKVFIGGDTGLSHVAAALGVPVVALYPDWLLPGKVRSIDAVVTSEWWEINAYHTPTSFLPNTNKLAVSVIGSNHTWSIDHVIKSIDKWLN